MNFWTNHAHRIGQAYRARQVQDPEEYLRTAESAAGLLRSIEYTRDGLTDWDTAPGDLTLALVRPELTRFGLGERPDFLRNVSLYNGTAGITHALMRLWQATGNPSLRELAVQGLRVLSRRWESALTYQHIASPEANYGYYFGIGGVAAVLREGWLLLADEEARAALSLLTERLAALARPTARGTSFTGRTGLMGDAGAMLALTALAEDPAVPGAADLALQLGSELLSTAEETPFGVRFERGGDPAEEHPNFVYGSAGTGFAFARLFALTGESRFLEAAEQCAEYLMNLSCPVGDGRLIPYVVGQSEPLFYLNTCHGPAGTGRLFLELYRQTGETRMLDFARALNRGMRALGAPERMSVSLWNNVSFCCGTAGILHFELQMHALTGEAEYLDTARRCGEILMGERETEQGVPCWPMAFVRVRPQDVDVRAGLFDGSLGVAVALAELFGALTGQTLPSPLPDEPDLRK